MNRLYLALIIGVILGAMHWAIAPFVSDGIEPSYYSGTGFYIGQSVLSIIAIILGYKHGMKHVLIYVFGVYISLNLYPVIFYFSKVTVYAVYGLYTTLSFCLYPFIFGMVGKAVKLGCIKYNKSLKPGTPKGGQQ
ncbi:MAG: hypothetical protein PVJ39_02470 [Gammaproteobacteria bacterium]|jgi:hypothetical protein